ncbi:MAG: hypothetical protein L0206_24205, partial [Actinobacteria bacterium]|nr:hypothetical protein [Actinomycetota bacterium]
GQRSIRGSSRGPSSEFQDALAVRRYLPSGDVDSGFGVGGTAVAAGPGPYKVDHPSAITVQHDGSIVVVGRTGMSLEPALVLARFLADGTPDGSFGLDGVVRTVIRAGAYEEAYAVLEHADGKLLIAGGSSTYTGAGVLSSVSVLARFQADGSPRPHVRR